MFAIKSNGIGKPVGARPIEPDWPLENGETFKSGQWTPGDVLAEGGQSLRPGTAEELALPNAARHAALAVEFKANGFMAQLRTATPAEIETFINDRVATLDAQIVAATNLAQAKTAMSSVAAEMGAIARVLAKAVAFAVRGNEG